jgi:LacI family transcriptional regulator
MKTKNEVTIYDIAEALKVSPSTVSRALNGIPIINRVTRVKILEKARSLGYRQDVFAARLKTQRTHAIGTLVHQLDSSFVNNIVSGAEITARYSGYDLIVHQPLNNPIPSTNIDNLNRSHVDGLLVVPSYFHKGVSSQNLVGNLDTPAIVLEGLLPLLCPLEKTKVDLFNTAYELTDHLAKSGCKRIAYMTSRYDKTTNDDLLRGYRQALDDNKLSEFGKMKPIDFDDEQVALEACRKIMYIRARPDGILFSNKVIAGLSMLEFKTVQGNGASDQKNGSFGEQCLPAARENSFNFDGEHLHELGKVATCLLICLIENFHDQ